MNARVRRRVGAIALSYDMHVCLRRAVVHSLPKHTAYVGVVTQDEGSVVA